VTMAGWIRHDRDTAITMQDTKACTAASGRSPWTLSLADSGDTADMAPDVIKTGMLGSAALVEANCRVPWQTRRPWRRA